MQDRPPSSAAVDASHLPPEKARAVIDRLAPTLDYLAGLVEQMEARGWKQSGPACLAGLGTLNGLWEREAARRGTTAGKRQLRGTLTAWRNCTGTHGQSGGDCLLTYTPPRTEAKPKR